MTIGVQIALIAGILFLMADGMMLITMLRFIKKCKNKTVEDLGKQLNPYLYATGIFSTLLAICMMLIVVLR